MESTSQTAAPDDDDDFAAFDDAVAGDARDPYPELNQARRDTPVQQIDMSGMPHEEGQEVFFVYRYDDVFQVLRDGETFSSGQIIELIMGDIMGEHIMLGMDDPDHGRYRSLVQLAFRQKTLAKWETDLVEQTANDLIDRFVERGCADLVPDFTFPYPTKIIAGLLGLPAEDVHQFQKWSTRILNFHTKREQAIEASNEVKDYLVDVLAERRAHPREDIISDLAKAELDGQRLTDEEIFSFVRLLMPAGIETTFRSTGNMLFSLLSNPDQLDAVRNDRSLVPQTIEEAIRFETPLLNITRVATKDTEIGGTRIPKGSTLLLMLASANRDDERYPEAPDTFNIHRPNPKPHIGFGNGPHVCIGMHLARLEMRTALNLLLDRLPNLRLDPAGDDPHIRGQVFRSPTSLPVLFG
ncbi:MAG TPA: cytochrome P450 [Mycobacteriales bacterium]|nr:cytochrome P450 [Mycobacteriales bacterium]